MQHNIKEISIHFHAELTEEEVDRLMAKIERMIYSEFNDEVLEVNPV